VEIGEKKKKGLTKLVGLKKKKGMETKQTSKEQPKKKKKSRKKKPYVLNVTSRKAKRGGIHAHLKKIETSITDQRRKED